MAYIPLAPTDNGSTSRATINSNFASVDTQLATKLSYTGVDPASGDMAVFSGTTGEIVTKKVFTADQTLESDGSGQPVSIAKGTAYNKNFGTSSTTVLEGSNDALYAKLAGTQTITGDKTFSGAVALGSSATATTQAANDNSTKVATTAYAETAASVVKCGQTTRTTGAGTGAQTIAHGCGKTPKSIIIFAMNPGPGANTEIAQSYGTATSTSDETCTYWYVNNAGSDSGQQDASNIIAIGLVSGSLAHAATLSGLDSTNITLNWGTASGSTTTYIQWTAFA